MTNSVALKIFEGNNVLNAFSYFHVQRIMQIIGASESAFRYPSLTILWKCWIRILFISAHLTKTSGVSQHNVNHVISVLNDEIRILKIVNIILKSWTSQTSDYYATRAEEYQQHNKVGYFGVITE